MFRGIGKAPKVRQAVGAGHLGRTLAQISHTAVFPFFCILVFPLARRKITRQGVEKIIVSILEYVFLAGHQRTRVLLFSVVAPFSPPLFHQAAILPLLFTVAFPCAELFLWDQNKQILVLIVQVIQRPAEGGQLLSQCRRPLFVGQSHVLYADGIQAFLQQRRDLCAPLSPKLRQSVLYGSVKFQNVQRIGYDLCPVWHESTLLFRASKFAAQPLDRCRHDIRKMLAQNLCE